MFELRQLSAIFAELTRLGILYLDALIFVVDTIKIPFEYISYIALSLLEDPIKAVKMTSKNLALLLLVSTFFVQGCMSKDSAIAKSQVSKEVQKPALQRCISQATILIKMDKKYEKNYRELYNLINDAKYYTSIAKETSEPVNATILPLLEYNVNNTCNTISQLLIKEFKNKLDQRGMGLDKAL